MNIILPSYTFAIRHPVHEELTVDAKPVVSNPELVQSLREHMGMDFNDAWISASYAFPEYTTYRGVRIDYLVNLPVDMQVEYEELLARGCHNLVLVHHVSGYSFAIGNV